MNKLYLLILSFVCLFAFSACEGGNGGDQLSFRAREAALGGSVLIVKNNNKKETVVIDAVLSRSGERREYKATRTLKPGDSDELGAMQFGHRVTADSEITVIMYGKDAAGQVIEKEKYRITINKLHELNVTKLL